MLDVLHPGTFCVSEIRQGRERYRAGTTFTLNLFGLLPYKKHETQTIKIIDSLGFLFFRIIFLSGT